MNNSSRLVLCKDIEGKTYQVPASELSFRPAVYAVIVKNAKILLSKQWDEYDFPGGDIELGEPTDEALKGFAIYTKKNYSSLRNSLVFSLHETI